MYIRNSIQQLPRSELLTLPEHLWASGDLNWELSLDGVDPRLDSNDRGKSPNTQPVRIRVVYLKNNKIKGPPKFACHEGL